MGRVSKLTRLSSFGSSLLRSLAALRFNPARGLGFDDEFGPEYEAMLSRILEDVRPK